MGAIVVLAGLALLGVALFVVFALVALLIRVAVRIVLLPLLLIKWLVMGVVLLVVGPVLLIVGAVALLAAGVTVAIPLLPFLAVGAIVWMLVKGHRRSAIV